MLCYTRYRIRKVRSDIIEKPLRYYRFRLNNCRQSKVNGREVRYFELRHAKSSKCAHLQCTRKENSKAAFLQNDSEKFLYGWLSVQGSNIDDHDPNSHAYQQSKRDLRRLKELISYIR